MTTWQERMSRALDVPTSDPDDARRRKLLNVLLAGMAVLGSLELIATAIASLLGVVAPADRAIPLVLIGVSALGAAVIVFVMNRYGPSWLAASLFLLSATGVIVAFEDPREVVAGRSLLIFAIPITVSAVLLRPWASFIMALLSGMTITGIALNIGFVPNPFAVIMFFAMAIISWLAARGLEQALRDLRVLNAELDQRVQDRTRDLDAAVHREHDLARRTQAILDSTVDGVVVFSRGSGKVMVANPAIAEMFCLPSDGIVGMDLVSLLGTDVAAEEVELLQDSLNETAAASGIKFRRGKRTFSTSIAPVYDDTGVATGTVVVFRDFTKEAEIDRMKSTFVSIASHELRTPLNAIMGYAEMMQEGVYGEMADKQRGAVARITANTGHMLGLVNNLLDRARMEAGTLTLNISTISAQQLVVGVHGVMDVLAQAKGLKLTSSIADDLPQTLVGDWQRLQQIMINLVNNAIKFTEAGKVDMRLYRYDETHWAISVADTGRGIAKDAQGYIFDPFRQVDDSATREYGGAGLGLSIVKQIVELMGGRIDLESDLGKGSTFTIILPVDMPESHDGS